MDEDYAKLTLDCLQAILFRLVEMHELMKWQKEMWEKQLPRENGHGH